MTVTAPLWGLDVSHYQGSINWKRVAAEGFTWMLAKATEGTTWSDATFPGNVRAARAVGLQTGAYAFLRPGAGAAQADRFYNAVRGVGGPAGMICVLDVEDGSYADVKAFVTRWRQITAVPIHIYTGAWYWRDRIGNPNGSKLARLHNSRYLAVASGPASSIYAMIPDSWWRPGYGGWAESTFFQFTSKATIAGKANVDADAFLGSISDLQALIGAATSEDFMATIDPAKQQQLLDDIAAIKASTAHVEKMLANGPNAGEWLRDQLYCPNKYGFAVDKDGDHVPTLLGGIYAALDTDALGAALKKILGNTGAANKISGADLAQAYVDALPIIAAKLAAADDDKQVSDAITA